MATPITVAATPATDRPGHNGEPGINHAKAAECLHDDVLRVPRLRNAATAPSMSAAFGL
jgi:hypothetical protein